MARIQLDIPEKLPFRCTLPLRITDMNYANHLGNDKVLTLAHEARAKFWEHLGYQEIGAEGVHFIMGDAAVVYQNEGFYGQNLIAEVGAGDFARVSFDLWYRFIVEETGQTLALVKTGMVCFDYETRKIKSLPDVLKQKLIAMYEDNPMPQQS